MDEKVSHRHRCPTDIELCNVRGYHECECKARSSLREPQRWVKKDEAAKNFIEGFLKALEETLESPLEKVIRQLNEIPQQCAIDHHFHAHHFSRRGLMHLCLKKEGGDEEACAKLCAKLILGAELDSMDLIHVGGGVPAFHSSHVIAEHDVLGGFHLDPARRN